MLGSSILIKSADQSASKLPNCHIVSIEWLLESCKAKKPVPEKPYILGSGQNGTAQGAQADDVQPDATGQKRAIKQEDEDDSDAHKKQKDPQKINFKNLNVPVDEEYFFESGHFVGESGIQRSS